MSDNDAQNHVNRWIQDWWDDLAKHNEAYDSARDLPENKASREGELTEAQSRALAFLRAPAKDLEDVEIHMNADSSITSKTHTLFAPLTEQQQYEVLELFKADLRERYINKPWIWDLIGPLLTTE